MSRRVLVTDAAGFIGSHLTDRLLDLGWEVVGFDNLSSGDKANLARAMENWRFRFVEGDLVDFEATTSVLGECGLIFPGRRSRSTNREEKPDVQFRQNLLATWPRTIFLRR